MRAVEAAPGLPAAAGNPAAAILEVLLPLVDQVSATCAEPARSLSAADVAIAVRACAPGLAVRVLPAPDLALRAAADWRCQPRHAGATPRPANAR